ncbi:acyl-CoA thioesterase [Alkalibacter mobilis]|uniref:acyl-CoA thioesterase n=1 Tax=Alkalibacter mobilis TaxID=2787712 RepID=UPI00189E3890|nr:acyl-CoA thioesterase [Alkalibacter mobilis]MBF7096478.1 acyl-CoA thioesterase [Alkalibacter mobilis]
MNDGVTFAKAETCLIMEPMHSNSAGNVHGGELMKIMDNVAGITAFKHAKGNVVTARVDEIVFHKPVHIGDILTCTGQLTYVGKTSMQIMVTTVVHDIKNSFESDVVLTAFFTMVHLVDDKPSPVPQLTPVTEEDKDLYLLGERKYREIRDKYL